MEGLCLGRVVAAWLPFLVAPQTNGAEMLNGFKISILTAVAVPALAWSMGVSAQTSAFPPPQGGYFMANGSRTADHAAALASWRRDAQFSVDYSKAYLGLEYAYALGLTGRGLTVGVNDAGVYMDHPLFGGAGKIKGLRTEVSAEYGNDGRVNPRRQWEGHGTHVAGTVAGSRIAGQRMFGNAFGANIYSATTNFSAGDFLWFRDTLINRQTVGTARSNIVDLTKTGEVRIISNSWGVPNNIPHDVPADLVRRIFSWDQGAFYKPILDRDVLVVFSAGNGSGSHAGVDASVPISAPSLRSNWLSVANYQGDMTPSPSTSFCGQTATWCVAGPGHRIVSSVLTFDLNREVIRSLYSPADYQALYSARTMRQLRAAGGQRLMGALNAYLEQKRAAAAQGLEFDEAAARTRVAQEAVAITLVVAGRINSPDGLSSDLAALLTSSRNMGILGSDFSSDVLTRANALLMERLKTLVTYKGPGYAAYTGTSMAAPNVAGFAALLMEHFPEYKTPLITDILLSSSKPLDVSGVNLKSGWGAPQMQVALRGPAALRAVRDVEVRVGTIDLWSNNIEDARARYSPQVLAQYPNDIGGIVKKGGGELILTGRNTYTGATRVEGGLLTVNGSLLGSTSTVTNTGILGGVGRLASVVVDKGGVLAPGDTANPFGTLTVADNLTFKDGSWLWIRSAVNGAQYSRVAVQGATTLEGGKVLLKADRGEWNLRTNLNILSSANGVTGRFTGAESDLGFLRPILTYGPRAVQLTLVRNDVKIESIGVNANQRSLGVALDVMTDAVVKAAATPPPTTAPGPRPRGSAPAAPAAPRKTPLEDAILDGSVANVRGAMNGLTGEVHATLAGVASGDTRFIREAMLTRGRNGTSHSDYGRGVSVWGMGVFGNGRRDNTELAGFRSETSGFIVGADKRLDGRAHIGVALGEGQSEIRANRLRSNGEVKTRHIGVYGAMSAGDFDFRLGASWMEARTRTDRTASLNRFNETLTGRYKGDAWQAYGEASWRKSVAWSTVLEPYLNYTHIQYDATVEERGGAAALSGKVKHTSDLVTAGLRTETRLANGGGRPGLSAVGHLAWSEDLNDDGPLFKAKFANGPLFEIKGADVNSGALLTGLTFNIEADRATNIEVGYAGVFSDDYKDHRLTGRVSYRF